MEAKEETSNQGDMPEELWYPEFGLKDDPFRYNDFNNELDFTDEIPRIKTEEVKRIKILRSTCFITGNKGDGKSTVLWLAVGDLLNPHLFYNVASPSLVSFYNGLFEDLCRFYRKRESVEKLFETEVNKDWFALTYRRVEDQEYLDKINCCYPWCFLRRRCRIPLKEPVDSVTRALDFEYLYWVLTHIEKLCPLKTFLIQKLIKDLPFVEEGQYKFLLDVPDDLYKGFDDFKETIRMMQKVGNAILMTTHEQHDRLKKSDYFSRFVKFSFLQMANEELKQLYLERVRWVQKEGSYPPLFTDEALEFIVKKSIRNPRYLLMICEEVVTSMRKDGRLTSADVEFIEGVSETVGLFSLDDYIRMLVKRYKEKKKRWVSVGQSIKDMVNLFNVDINEWSLGKKLATLHREGLIPDRRMGKGGKSEYLYYMGPSNKRED